jgi:hypothetical protein
MRTIVTALALVGMVACWGLAAEPGADGFVAIFNGKDLTGWDGDAKLWSVKDGAIRGEQGQRKGNTFCIWRGGTLKDFELLISFRIGGGNSGIQYRSLDLGNWVVSGYQAEVCNQKGKVGFLYHEKGRGYLCNVGEKVVLEAPDPAAKPVKGKRGRTPANRKVVGKLGDKMELTKDYKPQGWNHYRIVARGNHLVHYLNGVQTIDFTDNDLDDPKAEKPNQRKGRLEGILALQLHGGGPMWVEFKDIKLKVLEPEAK